MTDTRDLYDAFARRDPVLFAGLYSGNTVTSARVSKLLRLTPLSTLSQHRSALVDVLVALPELGPSLRHAWLREDPALTAQLFSWAERTRTRLHRAA